jgi:hypothetical protein
VDALAINHDVDREHAIAVCAPLERNSVLVNFLPGLALRMAERVSRENLVISYTTLPSMRVCNLTLRLSRMPSW